MYYSLYSLDVVRHISGCSGPLPGRLYALAEIGQWSDGAAVGCGASIVAVLVGLLGSSLAQDLLALVHRDLQEFHPIVIYTIE